MKKLSAFLILITMLACQSSPQNLEDKKQLLTEKEKALAELRQDIRNLKEEIASRDTTTESISATPVKVRQLSQRNFEHFLELTGTVNSRENILISAEASGRVERVPVTEGDKVSTGEVLVRLDNAAVQNQLEEARSVYELAQTTYEKRKNLWDQSIGSEIEYLQAKNNFETAKSRLAQIRSRYENTIIKSPISGSVDNIAVNEGEFVSVGSPLVRVVDIQKVEVEAELSEEYLPSVKKGDSVIVSIPALGYQEKATIDFVSQVINPANRSFLVKVVLPNKDNLIKPNLLANLQIRNYQNEDAIVIPTSSIGKDLKGDYVFVAVNQNGETQAEKKYIKRGKSYGAETEILEGLEAGDRLITAGSDEVNEGEVIAVQ